MRMLIAYPGCLDCNSCLRPGVHVSTGATYSHQGAVYLGGVYSKWMRKRTAAVLGTSAG